jgi:hypothetical protein
MSPCGLSPGFGQSLHMSGKAVILLRGLAFSFGFGLPISIVSAPQDSRFSGPASEQSVYSAEDR